MREREGGGKKSGGESGPNPSHTTLNRGPHHHPRWRRSSSNSYSNNTRPRSTLHQDPAPLPPALDVPTTKLDNRRIAFPKPINCNLDSFLEATSLIVRAQHLPRSCQWESCGKRSQRNPGSAEENDLPYFILGDLWESFDEWSAYGVGVPITLKDQKSVVQYYVPYLSSIQLYTRSMKRQNIERSIAGCGTIENVPDCRQCQCGTSTCSPPASSSSEGGSLCCCCGCYMLEKLSESDLCLLKGSYTRDWHGHLLFEFFESSPPYARVPLSEKISQLSSNFTALKTLRSVDLLPASWMSIAWYPIYRIPIGPTLRDLEACFLSFYCLSTSLQDGEPSGIVKPSSRPMQCATSLSLGSQWEHPMIKLEAFGLAHYKLRGSIWTSTGNPERRHAASMYRCAESWLKQLHVGHPDFEFFQSQNPTS